MKEQMEHDAGLMRRVAAGDQQACRLLAQRHLPHVFGLAIRMLGDHALAEDVAQESFVRLWAQARSWRADAAIGTWLYRVAHNLCIDHLRRHRRLQDMECEHMADPSPDPIAQHHHKQMQDLLETALRSLPERQRTAITLVHYRLAGNGEAAEIMGVSVEALESLLARGRRGLRQKLQAYREDLLGDRP